MNVKIINLTPHPLRIFSGGKIIDLLPSGEVARCKEITHNIGVVSYDGAEIPIVRKKFSEVSNLPEKEEGTIYVTSSIVAQAAMREDVVSPGDSIRDENGYIIGCKSLCSYI
ncbi:MAG: hypothetical protein KatS3mg031_2966 [Chitinophagales bacterium]|nr:MAG: hypothetical protein KatS3mg031_2966 [Chitinophagales bacterium]